MTSVEERRLRLWCRSLRVICVSASILFGFMVFGIGITAGDPDAWPDDPEIVLTLVALAGVVAIATGVTALRFDARLDVAVGMTYWLPPANPPRGKASRGRQAGSPGWARRQRVQVMWAVLTGLACSVVFVGGVGWRNEQYDSADQLLRTGKRVTGEVTEVRTRKGETYLDVRYPLGGGLATDRVWQDSEVSYVAGQAVTVVYDPADSSRIRTLEEKNIGRVAGAGSQVVIGLGAAGSTWSAFVVAGWPARRRRTRTTGWHEASAMRVDRQQSPMPALVVQFPDSTRLLLRPTVWSFLVARRAVGDGPITAFVSGTGRAMTMVVPRGRSRPRLIAVRAVDGRD